MILKVENEHFFFSIMWLFYIVFVSGSKNDLPTLLPPQSHTESHYSVNLCPMLYLKTYLRGIEPFMKKSDGPWECCFFITNNGQYMPSCAKILFPGL